MVTFLQRRCFYMDHLNVFCRIKYIFYSIIKKITGRKMIIDITGTILTPENCGKDCLGNGTKKNILGKTHFCCEECDYELCCRQNHSKEECRSCKDKNCPRRH